MYAVALDFKGLEMAMQLGPVASNGYTIYRDICRVQVRSIGIFEHTWRSEAHGWQDWKFCLLSSRCTPVGLGSKVLKCH